ncbi:hypothetical protein [Listeria fleischmannii]|uniref:hypothetical protein n=1 Tax=Listeria fleischmannii TaxID=1069827 RepID=UPI0002BBA6E6|nr:hypothetical protein [Listeria fleischmannii]EMG28408.1 hypothetical protein LFLEISCH_06019 [Listeria fleischmannii subsp. fleischmannii LU2006-1]
MVALTIIFTKMQYQNMIYKQAIQYVFGKSFWQSSLSLILPNLLVSFVGGSLAVLLSGVYVGYAFSFHYVTFRMSDNLFHPYVYYK